MRGLVVFIGGAKTSQTNESFTIVTTSPASSLVSSTIACRSCWSQTLGITWLTDGPEAAAALMKPANEDLLTERLVSKAVGNVKNNAPELLA